MGGMTTFGNNDSVYSHGEDSISMLNRMVEIAKEAYKYIPEKDCTVECGTFVDVDSRAFLSAIQHIRESIEAYRDITEELDDDLREVRKAYADDMKRIGGNPLNIEQYVQQLKDDLEHFRALAISRNKELVELKEQYDELKKEYSNLKDLCKLWREESAKDHESCIKLREELDYALKQVELWKKLAKYSARYVDTDIAYMYPKTTLNDPCNFCGNCKYYSAPLTPEEARYCKHDIVVTRDVGTCNNKWASPYIVDPDDASCPHFKPAYGDRAVIGKPEFPCCEKCNHEDCDDCTLCPF